MSIECTTLCRMISTNKKKQKKKPTTKKQNEMEKIQDF
jgi:hypothetical protein